MSPRNVGITGTGFKGFERAIDDFEKHVVGEVKRVIAETAEMLAAQAKALAPTGDIDGGNLKKSIEVRYYNRGLSAEIIVGAHYGIYVEWGTGIFSEHPEIPGRSTPWVYYSEKLGRWVYTRGMIAQPFFQPSFEQAAKHFEREMNKLG
jgi:HK97 gp10 family phage protein